MNKIGILIQLRYNKGKAHKYPLTFPTIIELCDIRNGKHLECYIVDRALMCQLLEALCTRRFMILYINLIIIVPISDSADVKELCNMRDNTDFNLLSSSEITKLM